jgi:hypothetical protein
MKASFGEADYLLYIDRKAIGAVEGTLTGMKPQSAKCGGTSWERPLGAIRVIVHARSARLRLRFPWACGIARSVIPKTLEPFARGRCRVTAP